MSLNRQTNRMLQQQKEKHDLWKLGRSESPHGDDTVA